MRHTDSNLSFIGILIISSLMNAACSSSGFSSANSTKASEKSENSNSNDTSISGANQDGSKNPANSGLENKDSPNALGIEGNAFIGSFETPSASDASTPGCTLPAQVQQTMGAFVESKPAATLALTGWGGGGAISQSQLGLQNLDLNSCQWFQEAKKDSVPRYMILYTKDGQSYAQPFKLAANAVTYAACITAATASSVASGGVVSCLFMPRS